MKYSHKYIQVAITDTDYFYMIENQIREAMPKFETGIALPAAIAVLNKFDIKEEELIEYPIEGYYNKSFSLKHYFTIIRNLQHNETIYGRVGDCEELRFLKKIHHSNVFGVEKPYSDGRDYNAPLKRRYDAITLTMEDKNLFDDSLARPWTIDKIVRGMARYIDDYPNLIQLAYYTKNPKCLCCSAETNSLNRMWAYGSGYAPGQIDYVWRVSAKVETLGRQIINKYNELFDLGLIIPNIINHISLNKSPETPRVALLGEVFVTGENYYWILDQNETLTEKYTTDFITTESFLNESQNPKSD